MNCARAQTRAYFGPDQLLSASAGPAEAWNFKWKNQVLAIETTIVLCTLLLSSRLCFHLSLGACPHSEHLLHAIFTHIGTTSRYSEGESREPLTSSETPVFSFIQIQALLVSEDDFEGIYAWTGNRP